MSATQPLRQNPQSGFYLRPIPSREPTFGPESKRLRFKEATPPTTPDLPTPFASTSLTQGLEYNPYSTISLVSPGLPHEAASTTSFRSTQGLLSPPAPLSAADNKRSLALGASSVASRMSLLAAAEALSHGYMTHNKSQIISGWLLGVGAVGGLMAAAGQAHKDISQRSTKLAAVHTATTVLGAACLVGGGYMRQWAAAAPSLPHSLGAMGLLAAGGGEALLTTSQAYVAGERARGRTAMQHHSQASLMALDIGVVITMTYGLATRLNNFPLTADYVVLGAAYATAMMGAVWQFADNIWLREHSTRTEQARRIEKATHWPTVGVAFALGVKIALLVGMKLLIDGTFLLEQWQVVAGGVITILCTGAIVAPQIAYFHRDIAKENRTRARQVTFGVLAGALLLAVGSGLREWAAINKNLPLARGSMALAALGAFSIVTCSSISLAASERVHGRMPMRHRAELALGLQIVGISVGIAYCLGIRLNKFNFIYDDLALCSGYLAMSMAGAMSYSESKYYANPPDEAAIDLPHVSAP